MSTTDTLFARPHAHQADIYAIYALFAGLAGTSFLGLYYGCKGHAQNPTDWKVAPIITVSTFVLIGFSVAFWRSIQQETYLFLTGAVIIISNASVASVYSFRARADQGSGSRWCATILAFIVTATPRLVVLICAFILNLGGRHTINSAMLQGTCAQARDPDEIARRIELLKQWDWIHGMWHYLTACALTAMGLSAQEGLMGMAIPRGLSYSRARCPDWCLTRCAVATNEFVEEIISRIVLVTFAFLCVILFANKVSSDVWMNFSIVACIFIMPLWSIFGTFHVLYTAQQNIRASIAARFGA